jgi:hypothetical protein
MRSRVWSSIQTEGAWLAWSFFTVSSEAAGVARVNANHTVIPHTVIPTDIEAGKHLRLP